MSETLTSSFSAQEVNAPVRFREYFQKYSQTTGASTVSDLNRKPFPRMVDFWFLAICVAVRKGLKPINLDGQETYKAIDGAAIVSPEWRTQALRLIAIAETKNPEVVKDPRQMMRIANGLAFAGMPHLIEILEQNPDDEALCLADELVSMAG